VLWASLCKISDGQSGTGTDFSLEYWFTPLKYHTTNASHLVMYYKLPIILAIYKSLNYTRK
jgi:hypothetical protein